MSNFSLDWGMVGEKMDCGVCWSEWRTVLLVYKCEGLGEWFVVGVEKVDIWGKDMHW